MKKFLLLPLCFPLVACDHVALQRAREAIDGPLTVAEISDGLKQALEIGVGKAADLLSKPDGYYKSPYKILLPPEARKVADKLKIVPGFQNVEEAILEKINRGAEDAAKKAKPIFVSAIRQMTFRDATDILMASRMVRRATSTARRTMRFTPSSIRSSCNRSTNIRPVSIGAMR